MNVDVEIEKGYSGCQNKTLNNKECQNWNSLTLDPEPVWLTDNFKANNPNNFCRKPTNSNKNTIGCFPLGATEETEWENCNPREIKSIPNCSDSCKIYDYYPSECRGENRCYDNIQITTNSNKLTFRDSKLQQLINENQPNLLENDEFECSLNSDFCKYDRYARICRRSCLYNCNK